jgi:hypothetical protein
LTSKDREERNHYARNESTGEERARVANTDKSRIAWTPGTNND